MVTDYPDIHVTVGWWECHRCAFRRYFATVQGALEGAAAHLMARHRIRLTLPVRHHGGLLGGGR